MFKIYQYKISININKISALAGGGEGVTGIKRGTVGSCKRWAVIASTQPSTIHNHHHSQTSAYFGSAFLELFLLSKHLSFARVLFKSASFQSVFLLSFIKKKENM